MSATALALVLLAAWMHATWNIVAKKSGGDTRFALMTVLFSVTLWAPVGLWAAWGVVAQWAWLHWGVLVVSACLHTVYVTALLRGYRLSDLTVVYPMARGTGPLLASLGAVVLLHESLSGLAMAGVGAVAVGVFLLAGGTGLWAQAHDVAQRARVNAGLRWGAITGTLIATYTLVDGYAVKMLLISPILVDYVGNLLRLPLLLPNALRDRAGFAALWRTQWRSALIVAVLGPMGFVIVLYAMRLAPISHVAPAREISMLFAALLGGRLLGEGDRAMRLAGAACMAAGVVALALG